MKYQILNRLALVTMLISLIFGATSVTAKKPENPRDIVYTAFNLGVPYIKPIDSHGADKWQIVFHHTEMDLSVLTYGKTFDDNDNPCDLVRSSPNPPDRGIMVLKPKSRKVPDIARLEYWFKGKLLESEDVVTYLLVMEGKFEPDNWPPTDFTTVSFNYWELAAENKWAQRRDCAGAFGDDLDPWSVTVEVKRP